MSSPYVHQSLLEFERHKTHSGELQLPIVMLPEVSGADVEVSKSLHSIVPTTSLKLKLDF